MKTINLYYNNINDKYIITTELINKLNNIINNFKNNPLNCLLNNNIDDLNKKLSNLFNLFNFNFVELKKYIYNN